MTKPTKPSKKAAQDKAVADRLSARLGTKVADARKGKPVGPSLS